jgi:enoyl-CoA hydratase/carnithine racemase/predicted thioesterase
MRNGLEIGNTASLIWTVGAERTIHLQAGSVAGGAVVLSTPSMIDLMEHAAREALRPYLEPGEESVGVRVEVEHLAATPIAAKVRAEAKVTRLDGRFIDFQIAAYDERDQIGRGNHRRAVIALEKFKRSLNEKAVQLTAPSARAALIAPVAGDLPDLRELSVRVHGQLATVSLNRPKQLNAISIQMTSDWEKLIGWLDGHPEVRVVIITGAGRAFCAGVDVKDVAALDIAAAERLSLQQARFSLAFEQLPQVVIAAVNGLALGGGCAAAYSCDFRFASTNAVFGMPEIKLGWPPGYGLAQLINLIGKARALELCVTGRQITAQTALTWGLVNEVVPLQRLEPTVREFADKLLAMAPAALRETKRVIHADEGTQPKITYLADTAAYIRCLNTNDAREGIAAFIEKRPPVFRGQ